MQGFITTPNALIIFIIFKLIQHLENESRNSRWGKRRRAVVLPLCPLLTLGTWEDYNWFDLTFSRCKNEDIFLLPSSQVTMKNQKKNCGKKSQYDVQMSNLHRNCCAALKTLHCSRY